MSVLISRVTEIFEKKITRLLMENEGLLLRPEECRAVPYSEPTGSSQHHHTLFSWIHFTIIFSFTNDPKSLK